MQILAEIFEDRWIVRRDGGEVVEGFVGPGYQACGRDIMTEDPAIDYLGEERALGNELAQEMRNVFLPVGHERLFISSASSKGNDDCFLPGAHGHRTQGGEGRQHGGSSRSGGCAKKFAPAPRDRLLDLLGGSQITEAGELRKPLTPGIVMGIEGIHLCLPFSNRKLVCCLHDLFCTAVPWIVSYFFRFCIFMFYLFEDCEVLVGQLLLVGATREERQTIMGTIVIGAKGEGLIGVPDGVRDPDHLAAQTLLARLGRSGDSVMESISWLAK
jgi:hypothetical protein